MTIKDIARMSGVGVSTVSRVINNRPDVSPESRRKVLAAIEQTNYIPNNSARDLVKTKSDAIGLIVRGVQNPFYTEIIHAIERKLDEAGYTMVMRQISAEGDEVAVGAEMEREKRLQGIIFLGGRSDYAPGELSTITVPYVFCSYTNSFGTLEPNSYSSVSIADFDEAYKAINVLVGHGHKKIAALVSSTDDHSVSEERYMGYLKALEDNHIKPDRKLVIPTGSYDICDSYAAVKKALAKGLKCTALFVISDNMAIGAMRAIREAGLRIPEDCSILAIDGLEISEYMDPCLTTLCQPMEGMGSAAVEQLLELKDRDGKHRQVMLPTTLRAGASVRTL